MKKLITLSALLVMSILGLLFGYQNLKVEEFLEENDIKIPFLSDEQPVVATVNTVGKPFKDESVKKIIEFYDSNKEKQEKSIIVIGKTYIPSKGIIYQSDKEFDVFSILDGTVTEVGKDDLTGNYIKINYKNLVITYKILDNISLSKGDYVKKGDKLGTSGNSEISGGNLLMIEIENDWVYVNPEDYYDKKIEEI